MTDQLDQRADIGRRLDNLRNHARRIADALAAAEMREAEALAEAAGIEDEEARRTARKEAEARAAEVRGWREKQEANGRAVQLLERQAADIDRARAEAEAAEQHRTFIEVTRRTVTRLRDAASAVDRAVDALAVAHREFRAAVVETRVRLHPTLAADQKTEFDLQFAPYQALGLVRARLIGGGVAIAASTGDPAAAVAAAVHRCTVFAPYLEPTIKELA